ncbi:unnamed protein product [Penicillium salamii]|nr:unnamed protein product [Penicillium salamii]
MFQSDKFGSFTKITTSLSRRNEVISCMPLNLSSLSDQTLQCFVQSKLWRYKLGRIFFASLLSPIKTFGD